MLSGLLLLVAVSHCSGKRYARVVYLCIVFAAGVLVGIAAFKDDWQTQADKASDFLGGKLDVIFYNRALSNITGTP